MPTADCHLYLVGHAHLGGATLGSPSMALPDLDALPLEEDEVDLEAIHRVVANAAPMFDRPRSKAQAQHMRQCKEIRQLTRLRGRVPQHTADRIDAHNEHNTVRVTDLINLHETRRPRYRGRGAQKRWLPSALLRGAFGVRRTIAKRPSHWLAASLRTCGDVFTSSSTHVQRVRQTIAFAVSSIQRSALSALPPAVHATLEIGFDETQVEACVGKDQALHSLFMVHGQLHWTVASGETSVHQLVMALACWPTRRRRRCMQQSCRACRSRLPS